MPPDSYSWGPQLRSCGGSQSWDLTFWCAYDFLLRHRPMFFRTIGTLEESYLKGIRELRAGRAVAISELQRAALSKKHTPLESLIRWKMPSSSMPHEHRS